LRSDRELHALHVTRAIVGVLDLELAHGIREPRELRAECPVPVGERRVVTRFELELVAVVAGCDRCSARLTALWIEHGHVDIVVAVRGQRADGNDRDQHASAHRWRAGTCAEQREQQCEPKHAEFALPRAPSPAEHHALEAYHRSCDMSERAAFDLAAGSAHSPARRGAARPRTAIRIDGDAN
jgi:hypothetical protein